MSKSRLAERWRQHDVSQVTWRQMRGCESKARYPSKRNAAGKAVAVERQFGERMDVYRCSLCSAWHIGHHRRWRRLLT